MKKATVKACLVGLGLCIPAASARAQSLNADLSALPTPPTYGYEGLPVQTPRAAPTGIKVGDGSILHVGAGVQVGYDSNVFYSETGAKGSGLLVAMPYVELTNAPRAGAPTPSTYYSLSAAAPYRYYFEKLARDRASGWSPGANGVVEFGTNQQLSLALMDTFVYSFEAPYLTQANGVTTTNDPIKHLSDLGGARVKYAPGGGRLVSVLQLMGSYDRFAADTTAGGFDYSKANSVGALAALDVSWKWLPKTAVYARVSQGLVHYTEENSGKNDSYPLHAMAGVRGLLTAKLSLNLAAGYVNAFYSSGPSPTGIRGNLAGLAELGWTIQDSTGFLLGYRHDFENGIVGNFYYSDAVYLSLKQSVQNRLIITLGARGDQRNYQGLSTGVSVGTGARTDLNLQAGGTVDYYLQTWVYAGVSGSVQYNHTKDGIEPDARAGMTPGTAATALNYTKYQAFVRLGVTY